MFDILLIALLIISVAVAFFRQSVALRTGVSLALGAVILVREGGIAMCALRRTSQSGLRGEALDAYSQGLMDFFTYGWTTGVCAVLAMTLMVVFCLRGFRRRG